MKILIAGAGIGGLTAALCLARAGFEIEIVERSDMLGEVGAGLQISPNGTRVLHELGLGQALEDIGFKPEAVELRLHRSGLTVSRLPLGDTIRTRHHFPYYHIHRGDLHRILLERVARECGDIVRTGRDVQSVTQAKNVVSVHFADGTTAEADALIGADGIHSRVQQSIFGPAQPRFTGMIAWRGVVDARRVRDAGLKPVVTSWMAPHSHAVTYFVRGGEAVNFVGVVERSDWTKESWTEPGNKADLIRDFGGWHKSIATIVEAIEKPFIWALFDRDPFTEWTADRVTLLGDACHPMLPFLAQGATMAIEDAYILARCLSKAQDNPAQGLARYQNLRQQRTARVQLAARAQGRLFHLAHPLSRTAAYGTMAAGTRILPEAALARFDWLWGYDALSAV